MYKKKIIILVISIIFVFTGCNNFREEPIIPEDIIKTAIKVDEEQKSFYEESMYEIFTDNKLVEKYYERQWVKYENGKIKQRIDSKLKESDNFENYTINNGEELIMYNKAENKISKMDLSNIDSNEYISNDYKDSIIDLLKNMTTEYDIKFIKEEKINSFDTYYIKCGKKEKSMFGKSDIWIDKKSRFTVKSVTEIENTKVKFECKCIKFLDNIKDELFIEKIPEGSEIVNMKDSINKNNVISMEKAIKIVGKAFLVLGEDSGYKLKRIEHIESKKLKNNEIIQTYEKDNSEMIILSITINEENNKEFEDEFLNMKNITIRGCEGFIYDNLIKLIKWKENELMYTIMFNDESISSEEIDKIVNKLKIKEL